MDTGTTAEVGRRLFTSTSWTLILEAGGSESSDQTRGALTQLCSTYWRPIYLFLRRQGYNWHDAEDLAQGFFADLIETRFHIQADPEKGRFRSFRLEALRNFAANRKDYESRAKRETSAAPGARPETDCAPFLCHTPRNFPKKRYGEDSYENK